MYRVPVACNGVGAIFLPDLLVAGNKHCIEETTEEGDGSSMVTFAAFCQQADKEGYSKQKSHASILRVLEHVHADGTTCSAMGMGKYMQEVLKISNKRGAKRGREHEQQDVGQGQQG